MISPILCLWRMAISRNRDILMLIMPGAAYCALSLTIGGSDAKDFTSESLTGLSATEMIACLVISAKKRSEKDQNCF